MLWQKRRMLNLTTQCLFIPQKWRENKSKSEEKEKYSNYGICVVISGTWMNETNAPTVSRSCGETFRKWFWWTNQHERRKLWKLVSKLIKKAHEAEEYTPRETERKVFSVSWKGWKLKWGILCYYQMEMKYKEKHPTANFLSPSLWLHKSFARKTIWASLFMTSTFIVVC